MSRKLYLAFLALSLCAIVCVVQGSVLGIDLGGEYMKISSISPGKSFVIVENTATRRKTQSAISFYNNERWLESDSVQKKARAFSSTFTFIQKYLGKAFNETLIEINKEKYLDLYKFEKEEEKGTIQFAVDGFRIKEDEPLSFTVEEIIAMYLKHAKFLADKQANLSIKDVVVTVPPYYGITERYALVDAIQLAGMNPLSFIHENTAAALYYGIERKDENKTHTVLFYNLGSTSLKVSLVEYSMENSTEKNDKNKKYESFNVLAETWEENVNGYQFDLNLARWLADGFDNQPNRKGKKRARDSPASMAKLIKEANKAKEVLSANKETTIYVEGLIDDTDLKTTVQRSQFEELNQAEFQLLTAPLQKALEVAGKALTDVDVIEVLGGALRIPKIQQILQEFVGKNIEVGAHMNGDEAMALGTSFHAASLSSSFKTRTVYMNDGLNFPIYATIRGLGDEDEGEEAAQTTEEKFEKNITLFAIKQKLGSKKALTFTYEKDLKVILYTIGPNGEEEIFSTLRITNVSQIAQKVNENTTSPKISLVFKLNGLGLVDLIKSEVYVEETKLIEETLPEKTKSSKKNKTTATDDSETNKTTSETGDDKETTDEKASEDTSDESTKNGDAEPTSENAETSSDTEKKYKKKVITHTKDLNVTRLIPSHLKFSETKTKALAKNLKKIEEFEELKKKKAESKNRLESFVYRSQELTGDEPFQDFSTEEEIEDLKKMGLDNEDWLYTDEAKTADHLEFDSRFDKMYLLAKRIIFRVEQSQQRPKVIADAYKALNDHVTKVKALNSSKPWIKESEKDEVLHFINKTKNWLDEKVEKLKALKKTDDPIVSTETIEGKITTLKDKFAKVKAIQKPKSEKDKTKSSKDPISDDLLFDMFLKYKNITISGVDDSFKSMFRSSMKSEYETWKTDFLKSFTESMNQKDSNKSEADTDSSSSEDKKSESNDQKEIPFNDDL